MKLLSIALLLSLCLSATASTTKRRNRHRVGRKPAAAAPVASLDHILTVEDHRFSHDKAVITAARGGSPSATRAAILALGRIGDTSAIEDITPWLNRKDRATKEVAIFSLSLMGDDTARKILMQNLPMQRDPETLAALLVAVGRSGNESALIPLANALKDATQGPVVWEGAAHGLGILWSGSSEKWATPAGLLPRLAELAAGAEPVATAAAFALARYKGDVGSLPIPELTGALAKASSADARAFLIRTLGKVRAPEIGPVLAQLLQAPIPESKPVREEAARALGTQASSEVVLAALRKALADPASTVVVSALESLGNLGTAAVTTADSIESLVNGSPSAWIRGEALKAEAKVQPDLARPHVTSLLSQPTSPLYPAAVATLGNMATQEDLGKLAELSNSPNLSAAEEAIETFGAISEDRITPPMKAELRRALEKGDTAVCSLVAQLVEKLKWKDFLPSLTGVYRLLGSGSGSDSNDSLEGKIAVLNAIGAVGDHTSVPLLERALNDQDRLVVAAAAGALKTITLKDYGARVPLNSRVNAPSVSMKEVSSSLKQHVILTTTRGEIEMKMLDVAPLTVDHFIRLVRKEFYDGKIFHRLVPDFVIQGGDPRGDGYGGPGDFIRDEVSPLKHLRGTVGIATSGKDTGGSQFFFNLAPNLHLDGKYTLFAEVTRGMDVVDQLEIGDKIITARVFSAR